MSEHAAETTHTVTVAAQTLEERDCHCTATGGRPHAEWESPWVSTSPMPSKRAQHTNSCRGPRGQNACDCGAEQSKSAQVDLTLDQASDLVGDDIGYWLNNPFMDREAIAQKICWWITRASSKGRQGDA